MTCCIFILIDYFCLRTKGSVKCIHILCTGLCIHTEIAFVKLFFCFLCAAKLVRHLFFEFEVEHNSSIMGQGWSIIGENFSIKRIFSESIIGEHLEHKRRFLSLFFSKNALCNVKGEHHIMYENAIVYKHTPTLLLSPSWLPGNFSLVSSLEYRFIHWQFLAVFITWM